MQPHLSWASDERPLDLDIQKFPVQDTPANCVPSIAAQEPNRHGRGGWQPWHVGHGSRHEKRKEDGV